jgi:O-antigen/teichoic acid export membrane protein
MDFENKKDDPEKKEDTLRKRYGFKLFSNFIGSGISSVIQLLVPRGLGPAAYGNFGFMTSFFDNLVNSLDTGSSYWFYTNLSKKKNDKKIVVFYRLVMAVLIFVVFIFVLIATITNINQKIWIDQSKQVVYLAAVYSIMTWILSVNTQIMDGYGLTVSSEKAKIVQKVISLLTVSILFILQKLNLFTFFMYNYFIITFLLILFIIIKRKSGYSAPLVFKIQKEEGKYYLKDLYRYIYPLIIYTAVGLVTGIVDRWLLQKFGGSIQQGYFTLSFKIGAIIALFTVSLTPLLMREFSIAFGKKDMEIMRAMFRRYLPIMYTITAYLSCFVAVQYDKIVLIFGGGEYKKAGFVVMIMAFYPIHQTYGQLTSTVYYATGQTRLYRNIGVICMVLGLPVIYFLLAPANMFGLNYGALGLAIKMVLINIITVNIWLYFNTRFLKLSFGKFLLHQFGSIAIILLIALLAKLGVDIIPGLGDNIILSFILSGVIYTAVIALISNYFPRLFGMDKESLNRVKVRLATQIRGFFSRIRKK